ncbi:MAG TPA: quinolinate synthase NadA, partial [Spirochaetota bacterium]|nr:quinolinate synthase NadA [Spirochaetota bacterium]
NSLKFESPEVIIDPEIIKRAEIPIKRMLDISEKLGL